MALTKQKKAEVVEEVTKLLSESKLTVVAKYQGTSVQAMQQLRRQAKESKTQVRVVKNRLFKQALGSSDVFKDIDTSQLSGQLMYAFNSADEAAPAQVLAQFAKTEPQISFLGAINADGQFMSAEDVVALANLPGKDQLRAQLAGTIAAPLSGLFNVVSGNVRGVLNVLSARIAQLEV